MGPTDRQGGTEAKAAPNARAPIRVLVVDDSGFIRRRLTDILQQDPGIRVVGAAADGAEALRLVQELGPDVVTMDVEMPVMDGITAVRRIMSVRPTPILMFSAQTHEGARATIEALEAGALDFLPKQFAGSLARAEDTARRLRERVLMLARQGRPARRLPLAAAPAGPVPAPNRVRADRYRLVVIGTSTGGPVALQKVLTRLPADFPLPLLLVQHMPAGFTGAFATRLDQLCSIRVKEAEDGDPLRPGHALLAPGGRQTLVRRGGAGLVVKIKDAEPQQHYRPSVDLAFASAAEVLPGRVLAVVMTGMGADGREGARALKAGGSRVWAQDAESCVVYGMPMAVAEAGLADRVLALDEIGVRLAQET